MNKQHVKISSRRLKSTYRAIFYGTSGFCGVALSSTPSAKGKKETCTLTAPVDPRSLRKRAFFWPHRHCYALKVQAPKARDCASVASVCVKQTTFSKHSQRAPLTFPGAVRLSDM